MRNRRLHIPFDGSVPVCLRRIGLVDADGRADCDALSGFARIFANQFYADLCDGCPDHAEVQELLAQLFGAAESAGPKQKSMMICLQYDSIYRYLPELILWLNRQPEAAELFSNSFLARLKWLEEKVEKESAPLETGRAIYGHEGG